MCIVTISTTTVSSILSLYQDIHSTHWSCRTVKRWNYQQCLGLNKISEQNKRKKEKSFNSNIFCRVYVFLWWPYEKNINNIFLKMITSLFAIRYDVLQKNVPVLAKTILYRSRSFREWKDYRLKERDLVAVTLLNDSCVNAWSMKRWH